MTDLQEECHKLIKYVTKEYANIRNHRTRERTLDGILEKQRQLSYALFSYEANLNKLRYRGNNEEFEKLLEPFYTVQLQVETALKILNETPINPREKGKRTTAKTLAELRAKRRTSESDNTLQVPRLELNNKSQSAEDLINCANRDDTKSSEMSENENVYDNVQEAAYDFPMEKAMHCIPEFHGTPEELRPFIYQIDYFADQFPEGKLHTPLLNVVYTKLKGEALKRLTEIEGETWDETKGNLRRIFKITKSIGTVMKEIETLKQGENENIESYIIRANYLYQTIEALKTKGKEIYADASLRKHFLGGLKSKALTLAGKSQRDKSFPALLEWIQVECEEEEELLDIHERLSSSQKRTTYPNQNQKRNDNFQWNNGNYNHQNRNDNQRNNSNYNHNNNRNNNANNNGNRSNQNTYNNGNYNGSGNNYNRFQGNSNPQRGYNYNENHNYNNSQRRYSNNSGGQNYNPQGGFDNFESRNFNYQRGNDFRGNPGYRDFNQRSPQTNNVEFRNFNRNCNDNGYNEFRRENYDQRNRNDNLRGQERVHPVEHFSRSEPTQQERKN